MSNHSWKEISASADQWTKFLNGLLTADPKNRWSAAECLNAPLMSFDESEMEGFDTHSADSANRKALADQDHNVGFARMPSKGKRIHLPAKKVALQPLFNGSAERSARQIQENPLMKYRVLLRRSSAPAHNFQLEETESEMSGQKKIRQSALFPRSHTKQGR